MAQGTSDPEPEDAALVVESGSETHHGILTEQLPRSAGSEWVVKHKLEQIEPVQIDLDSEAERLEWLDLTIDHLVQARGIGPELLVAKGVIPERFAGPVVAAR